MFAALLLVCAAEPAPPVFEVVNKTAPAFVVTNKVTDPYRMEYPQFYEWIKGGGRGVLVVGVPDRYVGTYETHCWVPSGFGGLRDGEYDCFGKNEMSPRAAPAVAAPRTFSGGCGCTASANCGASFCKSRGGTGCPVSCPVKK